MRPPRLPATFTSHQIMRFLENSWIFPIVEATHVIAMALLAGSMILLSVRTLGWLPANEEPLSLKDRLTPWIRAGAVLIAATGMVMLFADAVRYFANPAFLLKLVLLALILLTRNIGGRAGAWVSLSLWTLTVLASRAVIDFDIPPLYRAPLPLPL